MATAVKRKNGRGVGGTFRILIGTHLAQGPKGCECEACASGNSANHMYEQRQPNDPEDYDGDVFESTVDMELLHNHGPGSRKFERVVAVEPPREPTVEELEAQLAEAKAKRQQSSPLNGNDGNQSSDVNLDTMTLQQLRDHADKEKLSLKGTPNTRTDVLAKIKSLLVEA